MKAKSVSMKTLQICPILSEAVSNPWRGRRHFGPLLIIPMIVFIVTRFIQDNWLLSPAENASRSMILSTLGQWVALGIPYTIAFAILAIACHRSILLGIHTVPNVGFLGWTKRETRFALLSVALTLFTGSMLGVSFFMAFLITDACSGIFPSVSRIIPWVGLTQDAILLPLSYGIATFLIAYPVGRISLLLPATAVDRPVSFRWAWLSSKPHDIRLAFLIGAIPLGSVLLQDSIVGTIEEAVGLVVRYVLEAILYCSLLVVEIAILSICYRQIADLGATSSNEATNNPPAEVLD